jgi:carbon-monoxide dehydrogenase medium subunit
MNVPSFTYLRPADLPEACGLLAEYGPEARVLAGGTDLIVKIPGLDYIEYEAGAGLRIGALATIEEVKAALPVRKFYPVLHQAAAYMATVAIRNRATLMGNICNGSPSAETAPALIVLGAAVRVAGPGGGRMVLVEDFMTGPGQTVLDRGEIAVEVFVPEQPAGSAAAYEKFSLRRMDVALVGAAALVVPDGPAVGDVKIALSAVAPTPIRAKAAEEILRGKVPDSALIEAAARAAAASSRPISDVRARADLRRERVETLTDQVLRLAMRAAKMGVV